MSDLFGILGITDRDTTIDFVGQQAVYDAVNQVAQLQERETNQAAAIFVEDEVTNYLERYYLPSGGEMQESNNLSQPGAQKPVASWDVSYDLRDYRDQVGWDDVAIAYMTMGKLDAALTGVSQRHQNTVRRQILRHLLNNVNDTFVDQRFSPTIGSLVIRRLANNDLDVSGNATLYPPLLGTDTDLSGHSHYVGANYLSAAISNTNNPYNTIKDHLYEHFGLGQAVVFINNAERAVTEALAAFVPRTRLQVIPGATVTTLEPGIAGYNRVGIEDIPGEIIGAINDVIVSEWRWIPATYMLGIDMAQPGPLKRRVDLPNQLRGFQLVAKDYDFPLQQSYWRDRFGFGVGNRLNGVALQLVASTSYTAPTLYA